MEGSCFIQAEQQNLRLNSQFLSQKVGNLSFGLDLAFIVSVAEGLHFAELELIRLFPVVAEVDLVTLDALSGTLQHQPGRVEGAVEGLALDEARPIRLVLFCTNCE